MALAVVQLSLLFSSTLERSRLCSSTSRRARRSQLLYPPYQPWTPGIQLGFSASSRQEAAPALAFYSIRGSMREADLLNYGHE